MRFHKNDYVNKVIQLLQLLKRNVLGRNDLLDIILKRTTDCLASHILNDFIGRNFKAKWMLCVCVSSGHILHKIYFSITVRSTSYEGEKKKREAIRATLERELEMICCEPSTTRLQGTIAWGSHVASIFLTTTNFWSFAIIKGISKLLWDHRYFSFHL